MKQRKLILFLVVYVVFLLLAIYTLTTIGHTIGYRQGYEQGFTACIEENNLYERYENNETILQKD